MADQTFNPNINFYQSANADSDTIKNNFIIRLREYDIIVEDIRRNPMKGSVQHFLLLGRRGSGKSTLLKRIQIEIDLDDQLKQKYIAVNLAEEQANIYRLFDLWEAVKEELEHKNIEVAETEWNDDGSIYSRNLFAGIHAAIEKSGKKIILLLDNIDRIFENLKEDAALLRETLLNFDDIKIIGGSTRMTEHFWRYDLPFYEFFRLLKLEPLTSDEIKKLFLHWAEKCNLPVLKDFAEKRAGQLEAVRILTDGLPRTLLLFVNILVNKENGTGYEYMKLIMDRVTPLYQERLNNLPPAQRKVVLQLAFLWEAVGAREVADAARMGIKVVSAQLAQLADNRIVDKINTTNKNNLYRLSERFFNLWLIFTQGSPREKRRAKYLTIFLESFYDVEELKSLAEGHLNCLGDMDPGKAVLLTKAFAQSKYISWETKDLLINKTLELNISDDLRKQLPSTSQEFAEEIAELVNKKEFNKAIDVVYDTDQKGELTDYRLGYIYDRWGKYDVAEKYYLNAIERGGIKALFNLALLYENHKQKYDLAEKYYLLAIKKGEKDSLNNMGVLYTKQQKYDLAEKYYLLAVENGYANAMNNLAGLYFNQQKYDLAEKYVLLAVENGSIEAFFNIAQLYYVMGIRKSSALNFISKAYLLENNANTRTLLPVIKVWNGEITGIYDDLKNIIRNDDHKYLVNTLFHLLVHHQANLVNHLFSDPECGQKLRDEFQPVYYAALLFGKQTKSLLKIPPELQETVNGILKMIRERQAFYYES
jgi:TPR repeat protein